MPPSSLYPSLVVDLMLHFDDALTVIPDVPLTVPTEQAVSQATGSTLEGWLGAKRKIKPLTDPLILQRGPKNSSHLTARVPKSATVSLPGFRPAGEFHLTFDYRELPIDPRTVRSCAIDVHLGTVTSSQFARGMRGANQDGSRDSVLRPIQPSGFNAGTLVLRGIVDEWEVEHGSDGSVVTISGRDLRGVLLDTPMGAGDPTAAQWSMSQLHLDEPVDVVVKEILSYNKLFVGYTPVVDPKEWKDGKILAPGSAYAVPYVRKGAKGQHSGANANPPGAANCSFWDMIVRVCNLVGAIPYFVGTQLVIRPARGIYDQEAAVDGGLVPIPFAGGRRREVDAASKGPIVGGPLPLRRMVYGRDVESFSFKRQLGGAQRPKTVRVTSVDVSAKDRDSKAKMPQGRWPREEDVKARAQRVSPGGKVKTEEFTEIPVRGGITDPGQLEIIAKGLYEEIGRGEVGGSIKTPNVSSFGGDNDDPDLLRLRPGDAVELRVDTKSIQRSPPLQSTYTESQRQSFDSAVAQTTKILGDENLARVIVATARGQVFELQSTFRVSAVRYNWSTDSGISVDFDFNTYIEIRADAG